MKRIFLSLAALLIAVSFAACSGGSPTAPAAASSAAPAAPSARYDSGTNYAADYTQDYAAEYAQSYATPADPEDYYEEYKYADESATRLLLKGPDNDEGTKLVYAVDLRLQTVTFMEGIRFLMNTAADSGGYVQSSYVEGRSLFDTEAERYARYELKIPSARLSQFIYTMEDNYNLLKMEQTSQDITWQYDETDNRLESLREQEQRLLDELAGISNTDEAVSLEYELSRIQGQIGRLDANASAMDRAVIYSSVTVHLHEVIPPEPEAEEPEQTWDERLSLAASGSLNGFISFCQNLLIFLVAALPALILLAALIFIGRRVYRRHGKNSPSPAHDSNPSDPDNQ